MVKTDLRFRFAPSPNGYLHLGHAYSAWLNFQLAKQTNGTFVLRMEDIDRGRCKPEFEQQILEDLAWLGLEWEEPVLRQSGRFSEYRNALETLSDKGLIYPATWTRGQIRQFVSKQGDWPRDPDGAPHYPGHERELDESLRSRLIETHENYSWRLNMAKAAAEARFSDARVWGDAVIARKEVPTSYHLSVVVDDAFQDIGCVVRGQDLESATSLHNLLQHWFGLPKPTYFHHRLVKDDYGRKLSKSDRSIGIKALREGGATQKDVMKFMDWDETEVEAILPQII